MRAEQARQTETARMLAEMQANLTSIPSELRAVAEAQRNRPNIDVTSHMREAGVEVPPFAVFAAAVGDPH